MIRVTASIALVVSLASPAFAQTAAPAPQPAPDQATQLLQEVRRLREALENLVSVGARVQIVFGRLQLQEQRTATAARRADDARTSLSRHSNEVAMMTGRMQEAEEALRNARSPEQRENAEVQLREFKNVFPMLERERQRLAAEDSQAAQVLAAEQAQWTVLNAQLEELERKLVKQPN